VRTIPDTWARFVRRQRSLFDGEDDPSNRSRVVAAPRRLALGVFGEENAAGLVSPSRECVTVALAGGVCPSPHR
jgi:hypothetical protein